MGVAGREYAFFVNCITTITPGREVRNRVVVQRAKVVRDDGDEIVVMLSHATAKGVIYRADRMSFTREDAIRRWRERESETVCDFVNRAAAITKYLTIKDENIEDMDISDEQGYAKLHR